MLNNKLSMSLTFSNEQDNDGIEDYDEHVEVSLFSSDNENNSENNSEESIKKKNKKGKKREDIRQSYNDVLDWIEDFRNDDIRLEKEQKIQPDNKLLPWVEKFRPKTLDDVISHEIIINTLRQFIENNYFPHLLLSGPPGTGKTSAIMACARQLYGTNYSLMVLDINASEERGIEVVRNKIRDFICTKAIFLPEKSSTFKLVILDEADAMTYDAQAMLVSFIERYSVNVRFCLICNYIKKISQSIQSRCTTFKFSPLTKNDIMKKINDVTEQNKIKISKDGIDTLIKTSKGDMRKVLNVLQVTSMGHTSITSESITSCIGYPTPNNMTQIYTQLTTKSFNECLKNLEQIVEKNGYAITDIISELTDMIINKFMNKSIDQAKIISILTNMRDIEMNLTLCPNENIQLAGLVGIFKLVF